MDVIELSRKIGLQAEVRHELLICMPRKAFRNATEIESHKGGEELMPRGNREPTVSQLIGAFFDELRSQPAVRRALEELR